jgi:uncharacterized protein YdeI (YjbR/CyaY-like superfamily)
MSEQPIYFATPEDFRAWLEAHHATHDALVVGFLKRGSGRPCMTWPESVDQALCFGWIDGVRRGVDEDRYTIRFTPRRARSTWSTVNVARATELLRLGHMHAAGQQAFEARETSGVYSYEQRSAACLTPEQERLFRRAARAWHFFESQPPGYRRTAIYWVTSAKKQETRAARLATLIRDSAAGVRIGPLRRTGRARDGS